MSRQTKVTWKMRGMRAMELSLFFAMNFYISSLFYLTSLFPQPWNTVLCWSLVGAYFLILSRMLIRRERKKIQKGIPPVSTATMPTWVFLTLVLSTGGGVLLYANFTL